MLAALIIFLSVLASVGVHYEALQFASAISTRVPGRHRFEVMLAIILVLIAHLAEILVFAVGWTLLMGYADGSLNVPDPNFADLFYVSGACYTSLGFGDIVPLDRAGQVFSVVEGVTGLVMIAWTSSFTFYQMRRNWPQ